MPEHKLHRAVSKNVLGNEYPEVHMLMDLPIMFKGSGHREFFHDPTSLAALFPNSDEFEAALLHIFLDQACTNYPEMKWWIAVLSQNI